MPLQYYSPQQLVNEIYYAVMQSRHPMTRLDICRAIGRTKAPHIVKMIDGMAKDGWLQIAIGEDRLGRTAYVYSIQRIAPPERAEDIRLPD